MTAMGTAGSSWCGCSCLHCRVATAWEGGKADIKTGIQKSGLPNCPQDWGWKVAGLQLEQLSWTRMGRHQAQRGIGKKKMTHVAIEEVPTIFPHGASQTLQAGSFPQLYATTFLCYLKERKRQSVFLLELKLKLLNHLESRSVRFHFSGTETCSSPRAFKVPSKPRATMSKRLL